LRSTNPVEERIIALIEPAAGDMGYRLVRVRVSGLRRKRLQIMAERVEDGGMGVGDCESLSRAISPVLDAADPINGEYDLEVSSPGIDRPLVRIEDFERFIGHDVKVETAAMTEGRKRFKGEIAGVDGQNVRVATADGEFTLPFAGLSEARLVLTDKLIEEDLKRAEGRETKKRKTP
jgi:ribosome maturation factor RimP